ncbi:TrbI/VirB10 family protein [Azohydromonas lata]|uniref:TrbI/VirB10 family protein n=1 Tax=Azohydromonas lata TaxID=45677 RepID=A0ABU5IK69_9BURK|nr:TrbI/VirB10 family protein [Azohydromonas lata]MDZ5459286.1 TrbI/VirB10 family protein [Azohydromonas lata]
MSKPDLMSPSATPGQAGVRRVNKVPMILLTGALAGFVSVMAVVAYQRAAAQHAETAPAEQPKKTSAASSLAMAKAVVGDPGGAIVNARVQAPPPAASGPASAPIQVARPSQEDLDRPPRPQGGPDVSTGVDRQYTGSGAGAGGQSERVDQAAEQMQQARMQQFMAAVLAPSSVTVKLQQPSQGSGPTGAPANREEMLARMAQLQQQAESATQGQDPMAVYRARLAQVQAGLGGAGNGVQPSAAVQPAPARNGMAQFDNRQGGDRFRLDSTVEAADTPYLLRAGKVSIPLILQKGINSELPGQIEAMVSRNIFDTRTGQHLLIPQGTVAQGAYSSEVVYGQARVLIAIQRLIFPDDSVMDLGAMPGADSEGYAGLKDRVDNHYVRIFGSAFLMSGVTAGIAYSQRSSQNPYGAPTFSGALSEAVGQQLGQATAQMLNKNMNLAPTLQIRPGYRFTLVAAKDLRFPGPYKGTIPRSVE